MLQQFYPNPPQHNYRYELHKDMQFSAAHYIPNEKAGICQNMHGHTYFVDITVVGNELDETGFLINFKDIKKLIHGRFDHSIMNDKMKVIPSTELVAEEIYRTLQFHLDTLINAPKCIQVVVRETPTSYVVFRPKRVV